MTTSLLCASHSPLMTCFAKEPDAWQELQEAYANRATAVADFDPELVIAFGSDHYNGFFLKLMPAFCVGFAAHAVADIGGTPGTLNVDSSSAVELVNVLRAKDVDPATSTDMTLDHAFSQSIATLCGGLGRYPTIPVFINCISEPYVPFRRSRLLGAAVGEFAASSKKRVLFLASGGMSHHPRRYYPELGDGPPEVTAWQLSGGAADASLSSQEWLDRLEVMHHEGAEMIVRGERTAADMCLNAEADQRFLDVLTKQPLSAFDAWEPEAVVREAGIGSMELHTWIAACAAHEAAGGGKPSLDFYAVTPELGIATGIVSA